MRGSGIEIPPVDSAMLDRYIGYLTVHRLPAGGVMAWRRRSTRGSRWTRRRPAGPVAFHDDLSPASLLDAYRHGLYPIPADTDEQKSCAR